MNIDQFAKQPLFWGWILAAVWLAHVLFTLFAARWAGLTISLAGLLAIGLVLGAIMSRRHKNLHPEKYRSEEVT